MGRLKNCTDHFQTATSIELYEYDDAGRISKFTDRRGMVTRYQYDNTGRRNFIGFGEQGSPPSATYESTINIPTPTYQTNAQGQLERTEQVVDSSSGTITRTYDQLGRLVAEVTLQGSVSYSYDKLGRRQSMTVAGQPTVSYTYDSASRLTQITQGSTVVGFGYDYAGRRTTLTLPNNVTVTYTYDKASQLSEIVYKRGTTTLGNLTYSYDLNGNRSKIGGTWARTGLPDPLTSASYNAANQQTAFAGQTLTYDLNGNLTNDGNRTYTWNARNQLVVISSGAATIASFQYDAFGRRINKTIGGTTTGFFYDGANTVQELNGASPTANLLTGGIDENFLRSDASGTSTFLAEGLGSTVALLDAGGATVSQYTYQPFGVTSITGSSGNSFQFTGRENDGTGLYYYRARYYHPTLQRFISEDPIGFGGGINYYAYAANDPVNLLDPLGLFCIKRIMLVTSYNDTGPGKDWNYYKPLQAGQAPRSVGPGTVAVANTRPVPYPFGSSVTVYDYDGQTVLYRGDVHDTGAGWNPKHHNVQPDQWIDIWLPGRQANKWGTKYTWVEVCTNGSNDSCKE